MWWRSNASLEHNIEGMVWEELRRLGYAGRQPVPKPVFHTALGFVCCRLRQHDTGAISDVGQCYASVGP
jgi:hypothetical protein